MPVSLEVPTAKWAVPHIEPATYKGARGGRSSGKSHFFAEMAVEEMLCDPDLKFLCVREVQKSLEHSAKSLIEAKIREHGLEGEHFRIMANEIRRCGGAGVMIFHGMQDHTADSMRSLEGFSRAWVEEAHSISQRSLELLIPTIRAPGSEIWFSWNPSQPDDPVEQFFDRLAKDRDMGGDSFVLTTNTYLDNPFCPPKSIRDADRARRTDPDRYDHIWLGGFNVKSDLLVLAGKWEVEEFKPDPEAWDGPYFGVDWGFSQDPTVIVRCWIYDNCLWIDHDDGGLKWDFEFTARRFREFPGAKRRVLRADSARPDTINEIRKRGLDVRPADKWSGSVEDGITFLRTFRKIVIHERCERTQNEARHWSYKKDRLTGEPLPKLEEGHDHIWDAVRYALAPLIHEEGFDFWVQ